MITEIEKNKKVDILLMALKERYDSIHKIRDRVQAIGIWTLGILVGIGGWLIQSDVILTIFQKIISIGAVMASYCAIQYYYFKDLNKGFKGQQRAAVKIEKALGFFTPKFFNDEDKSFYDQKWEMAGTDEGEGNFFSTSDLLILIGVCFVIGIILVNGCWFNLF